MQACADNIPADTAEAVDTNFYCHFFSCFFEGLLNYKGYQDRGIPGNRRNGMPESEMLPLAHPQRSRALTTPPIRAATGSVLLRSRPPVKSSSDNIVVRSKLFVLRAIREGRVITPFVEPPKTRLLHAVAILTSLLPFSLILKAQPDETEIARARDEFMSKVFTKCNDETYYFGPHQLDRLDCVIPNRTNNVATAREVQGCAELIEYKDLKLAPVVLSGRPGSVGVPMTLHPQGTLEFEDRVFLLIGYTSYRSQLRVISSPLMDAGGRTQAFEPWGKSMPNVMPSTVMELGEKRVEYRLPPGTQAFGVMAGKNGHWIFAPGPDFPLMAPITQVLGRVGLDGGPVANAAGERTRTLGPAALSGVINLGTANVIRRIASEKPASCDALARDGWGVPRSIPVPPLFRPGTVLSPAASEMVNPPKFAGTADQVATAFPSLLQQAAAKAGLDAQAFAKESEFVVNSIRTCAQITPAMAEGTRRKDLPPSMSLVNIKNLPAPYAVCVSGGVTDPNAKYPDTRLALQIQVDPDGWQLGKGFRAFVFFVRPKGNRAVVLATIPGPGPATKAPER
jgi:hypothetical protein